MKLSTTLICIALVGCIHPMQMTQRQYCARNEMIMAGQESCRKPTDATELCEIEVHKEATEEMSLYNENCCAGKNIALGVGYYLLVVPGVVMYLIFDGQQNRIRERSEEFTTPKIAMCKASPTQTAH